MDTLKLADMSNMFDNSNFEELNFGTDSRRTRILGDNRGYFNTKNIQSSSNTFTYCGKLKKVKFPPSFNVGKSAKGMFKGCTKLEELDTIPNIFK